MKPILLDIPMLISTPRLLMRPPQAGDGPALNAAIHESLKELTPWMPWARTNPTVEDSEENVRQAHAKWLLREDLRMSVFDREKKTFIGGVGLHRIVWDIGNFEVGYWTRTSSIGKGYATEAANAMTRFAFRQLGAKRVELRCSTLNEASVKVANKLGFELEGILKGNDHYVLKEPRDTRVYARLTPEGLPPLEVSW